MASPDFAEFTFVNPMHGGKADMMIPLNVALENVSRKAGVRHSHLQTLFAPMVIIGMIVCSVVQVLADDSLARFGAGGIELLKSKDIRMLEEVLEISTKTVRVRFRFLNESDRNIDTIVAFPLPPYPPHFTDGRSGVSNPSLLMATFRVRVNGKPIHTKLELKAIVNGLDVTKQLRALGLSDEQIFEGADLRQDQGAEEEILRGLTWNVAETRFWHQSFPARKEIIVEHSYEPAVGFSYLTETYLTDNEEQDVCLDDVTKRGIDQKTKAFRGKSDDGVVGLVHEVEYILGTGRNWKGPIGDFTLRIEKDAPNQIVSLCFPGKPKKVSPTVVEFRRTDFVPPERLLIRFY